jgi:threonine dehydrogenase-like Zn-dependent dehydrogenase
MQVAGIRETGGRVETIEASEPRPLASDEVLIEVRAAGVAIWDEIVRTGDWDVGAKPPMALGTEAAGTVLAVGRAVGDWAPGDAVMTHPVPLRDQGAWAPRLIAKSDRKSRRCQWDFMSTRPRPNKKSAQCGLSTKSSPAAGYSKKILRSTPGARSDRILTLSTGRPGRPTT